jgi:nucleoid-associated protein YgaU
MHYRTFLSSLLMGGLLTLVTQAAPSADLQGPEQPSGEADGGKVASEVRLAATETKSSRVGTELAKAEERIAALEKERDALAGKLAGLETECAADKKRVETLTWANEVLVKELDSAYAPEKPVKVEPLPKGMRAIYTVQKGESLSTIAQTFYGDSGRWQDLFEANRADIENPDVVEPGTVILIPR